ncbi:MAG TPA: hypothetical protein VJJ25_05775 [Nitrosopumilaceae archaeon]|nr:hypothetical protein [Nitrosopumilaceae archaeon]
MMWSKTGFLLITAISLILSGLVLQTIFAEETKIPEWIKNNAKWWSDGEIDDKTFASGIQFMIKEGIIFVDVGNSQNSISNDLDISKCDKYETPAEKRICQKEIELTNKIKNDIEKSTKYVVGPVNFYYVDNKIEKTS